MKIHTKILLIFVVAALGVGYFFRATSADYKRSASTQELINHTNEVIRSLDNVYSIIAATESTVRGYAITGDPVFLQDLPSKNIQVQQVIKQTAALVKEHSDQLENLDRLNQLVTKKLEFQHRVVQGRKSGSNVPAALISTLEGKRLMDSLTTLVTYMKQTENSMMGLRMESNRQAADRSMTTNKWGGIISFVFTMIVLLLLNRDMSLRKKAEAKARMSEEKYRELIENASVVMFTATLDGDFKFVSSQVEQLTGYSREELISANYSKLVDPESFDEVQKNYVDFLFSGQKNNIVEFPMITKANDRRWVQQECGIIYENGQPAGFQCQVRDVTERKFAEDELKRMEEEKREYQSRIQSIFDNTPLMIYTKDLNGKYTMVNRRFSETFRLNADELLGKTVFDISGDHQAAERYTQADRSVIKSGKPVETEDVLILPDGEHHLLTIKFPLFDKHGELFAISGIGKDITEMVRYREQLISARKKAEQAEKLQEQFLANMSHEIRTPMNGIVGMTNLLAQTPLSNDQLEFVDFIRVSSDTLLVLINDILDLSKIKAGKLTIEKIGFDLSALLNRISQTARMRVKEKGLTFNLEVGPEVAKYLVGDPHRLEQVLNNLLSNAVKFTDQGSITLKVTQCSKGGDLRLVQFAVRDTGIGIDQDKLDLIFESFSQAGADTTRKFGGTGLGLAITKNLAEMQDGQISVSSAKGIGSTFTVAIPYTLAQEPQIRKQKANEATEELCLKGRKVLIVEDNEINQKVLYHHLKRFGIEAEIAGNGKEAVLKLEAGKEFELLIMDLQMPEMNGFQATTYIRKKLNNPVPIVAMTASVLRDERVRCLDVGMNAYLSKPFSPDELQQVLHEMLTGHSQQKAFSEKNAGEMPKGYDLSLLSEVGEDSFISEVLQLFLTNTPVTIKELREEVIQENWEQVWNKAHKLKSSVGVLQISSMMEGLVTIEQKAKAKEQVDLLLPLVDKLETDYNLLRPMLEAEQHKNKSLLN